VSRVARERCVSQVAARGPNRRVPERHVVSTGNGSVRKTLSTFRVLPEHGHPVGVPGRQQVRFDVDVQAAEQVGPPRRVGPSGRRRRVERPPRVAAERRHRQPGRSARARSARYHDRSAVPPGNPTNRSRTPWVVAQPTMPSTGHSNHLSK